MRSSARCGSGLRHLRDPRERPGCDPTQIVGTDRRFSIDEIGEQLRDIIVARFADVLGESKIPMLDLAGNYDELGKFLCERIAPDFGDFGLELVSCSSRTSRCRRKSSRRWTSARAWA